MDNRVHYIYCHTAPNGKRYVGQTTQDPKDRWSNGHGYYKQKKFYRAIKKYGWNNFKHEILKTCCYQATADYLECFYIKQYDSASREHGYNLTTGGGGAPSHVVSEELRQHLSRKAKERGISPENRRKMLEGSRRSTKKRKPMSLEQRQYLSKIRSGSGCWIYGKTHSPETKAKMSATRKGRKRSKAECEATSRGLLNSEKVHARRKPVLQYDTDGNFIARHVSLKAAGESIGTASNGVREVCIGKKDTFHGYVWEYEDEDLRKQGQEARAKRKSEVVDTRKPVEQLDLDGNVIACYESILAVEKKHGFSNGSISACCRGKSKQSYGYRWRYAEQAA